MYVITCNENSRRLLITMNFVLSPTLDVLSSLKGLDRWARDGANIWKMHGSSDCRVEVRAPTKPQTRLCLSAVCHHWHEAGTCTIMYMEGTTSLNFSQLSPW